MNHSRPPFLINSNNSSSDVSDDDDEVERPLSHSLPLPTSRRSVGTNQRRRRGAIRLPQYTDRDYDWLIDNLISGRGPPQVQDVAETEEEGKILMSVGYQVVMNWSIVYQRRVVEFLRQDDVINVIASRYDGAITEELR